MHVLQDNDVDGDHTTDVPFVTTDSCVLSPLVIWYGFASAVIVGLACTVIFIELVSTHGPLETMTEYVWSEEGETLIDDPVDPSDHKNDEPPEAVNVNVSPEHIRLSPVRVAVGIVFIVIKVESTKEGQVPVELTL
jgi:hypothetical protein